MSDFYSYFRKTLLFILLLELFSLWAWLLPAFGPWVYSVVCLLVLVLAVRDLKSGLLIAVAELIIGSQGYLLAWRVNGMLFSLRMGIFAAVMLAWLIDVYCRGGWGVFWRRLLEFKFFKAYVFLAAAVLFAFIRGWFFGHNFGYLFLDFNNWLFFLYLLPLINLSSLSERELRLFQRHFLAVVSAALFWLTLKSLFLLYIFSHHFLWALPEVYQWVRDTRIGEITVFSRYFSRIFLQSQLYALLAFLWLWPWQFSDFLKIKRLWRWLHFAAEILLFSVVILSFSRSFWLALLVSLLLYYIYLLFKKQWLKILNSLVNLGAAVFLAVILLYVFINLPPAATHIGGAGNLLIERGTRLEASGSSRINMLGPLLYSIVKHPFLGSGFGATVTYRSVDPRILSTTAGASGEYTTYAFEWAYLDLWLKLGLLGCLAYLYLLFKLLLSAWPQIKKGRPAALGLSLSLIALAAVNFFTPYLNHPLGIAVILGLSFYWSVVKDKTSAHEAPDSL